MKMVAAWREGAEVQAQRQRAEEGIKGKKYFFHQGMKSMNFFQNGCFVD